MGSAALRSGPRGPARDSPSPARARRPCSCLTLAARTLDLRRVLVRVGGIDAKPVFRAVPAALCVLADDLPVVVAHAVEELCRRLASKAHGLERWLDRTITGQPLRESFLVVSIEHRLWLGEQAPDADRRHHLAVGEVVCDLPRRPAAVRGTVALLVGDAVGCLDDR